MGVCHYTDMGKWEKKPMCRERDALARRRGMNTAYRGTASELAIVTAALLVEEEELARAEEEV